MPASVQDLLLKAQAQNGNVKLNMDRVAAEKELAAKEAGSYVIRGGSSANTVVLSHKKSDGAITHVDFVVTAESTNIYNLTKSGVSLKEALASIAAPGVSAASSSTSQSTNANIAIDRAYVNKAFEELADDYMSFYPNNSVKKEYNTSQAEQALKLSSVEPGTSILHQGKNADTITLSIKKADNSISHIDFSYDHSNQFSNFGHASYIEGFCSGANQSIKETILEEERKITAVHARTGTVYSDINEEKDVYAELKKQLEGEFGKDVIQAQYNKTNAEDYLKNKPAGTFIIRPSSVPNTVAFSHKTDQGVGHAAYKIPARQEAITPDKFISIIDGKLQSLGDAIKISRNILKPRMTRSSAVLFPSQSASSTSTSAQHTEPAQNKRSPK